MQRIALVHDWLLSSAGAERFLKAVHDLFPGPIHTLLHDKKAMPIGAEVKTSWLQKLPFSHSCYRYLLPLFPRAIEQFDLADYDLILSSSHAVAKNVLSHSSQLHICYCHTPMRYAWDLYHEYMKDLRGLQAWYARRVLHRIRTWDAASSARVDHFLANSHYVAKRIEKIYRRPAKVIYPPVATDRFSLSRKEDFYLTVSRLVPYKKVDLLVRAFSHLNRKLVVVGKGPEMSRIKAVAGKNVEILEEASDPIVAELMSKAKAFLFAAEEDFGLAPVEAQAAGTPVIAYGKGGVLETVVEGQTGLFFQHQEEKAIVDAVKRFEQIEFCSESIRQHALKFDESRFKSEFQQFVKEKLDEFFYCSH
jgi:glycosyltransferase involved in cell wall biosynthesis